MTINIDYELEDRKIFDFDYEDIIKTAVRGAVKYMECPYDIEVNVLITDNEQIRIINKETRDIDKETDVLSFPMLEYENAGEFSEKLENCDDNFDLDTGELILGDIVLSADKIVLQANEYGHTQVREMAFLVVHSMLHLFGFDHMEDDERVQMEEKQNEIMQEIGILR